MNADATLARLLDLEALKTLKHRYIRCVTKSYRDALETLLTADAHLLRGYVRASGRPLAHCAHRVSARYGADFQPERPAEPRIAGRLE